MRSSKSRSRSKTNRNRPNGATVVNRVFDSSGPEGKVRGTPQQIIDKYNQLARDAQLSNDRVATENFQQHAEHYLRMLNEAQREIDARREEQERQNRERQAERDRERERAAERSDRSERQDRGERSERKDRSDRQETVEQAAASEAPAPVSADTVATSADMPKLDSVDPRETILETQETASDTGLVETPEGKTSEPSAPPVKKAPARKPRSRKPAAAPAADSAPTESAAADTPPEAEAAPKPKRTRAKPKPKPTKPEGSQEAAE